MSHQDKFLSAERLIDEKPPLCSWLKMRLSIAMSHELNHTTLCRFGPDAALTRRCPKGLSFAAPLAKLPSDFMASQEFQHHVINTWCPTTIIL